VYSMLQFPVAALDTVQGGTEMWGGHCGKKKLLHWVLEYRIQKLMLHKTTFGPLIETVLYIMLLMRANPLRGQWGVGWALESITFEAV
jgi:hypothetical protein